VIWEAMEGSSAKKGKRKREIGRRTGRLEPPTFMHSDKTDMEEGGGDIGVGKNTYEKGTKKNEEEKKLLPSGGHKPGAWRG